MGSSEISGFYKLTPAERLEKVKILAGLTEEEVKTTESMGGLSLGQADRMIENVIGGISIPLGIAVNFLVNSKDYLIPMAIEEPSVVAAASHAAKIARVRGGFWSTSTPPIMIGQIQIVDVPDPISAKGFILKKKMDILKVANDQDPILSKLGGGAKDLEVKIIDTQVGPMVITELMVDCRDAMGANAVNTMAEAVAPMVEEISGGRVNLRILSNLATKRLVKSTATFEREALGGEVVVDRIIEAYAFAAADPYRAATHNKGVMNGITSVVLATGNDTRAIEAGAHAYASRLGRYTTLTTWKKDDNGDLSGVIEMPLAVGLIGGATVSHPMARIAVKILGVRNANELGEVIGAVGLAQNLAALRALATEGIQRGHMRLHARNVAVMAGASGELIDKVAEAMVRERKVRADEAKRLLHEMESHGKKT
ncbi:hydroxymethylglutaryl-CoA reductase, degradative [Candidatus Bathyarchaeota archaeon RBG_16_48_13]|nr:MAG: hydroxymethylglutaryl-CoA reductase, degradative [Candidatus Bathyarchaeota archaeon RBG_16_48_13]